MRLTIPYTWRAIIAATHDTVMAAASFIIALYLRLGQDQFNITESYLLFGLISFTGICLIVFISMRLYRGLWRFASLPDLIALVKAVTLSVALFSVLMFMLTRLEGIPRSLPVINWLLLLVMLGAPRFLYRALKDRTLHINIRHDASKQIPLLLAGANRAAELFIRDNRHDTNSPYRVAGLIDEDPQNKGRMIHGIGIHGDVSDLEEAVNGLARKGLRPQRIIICGEDMSSESLQQLLHESTRLGLTLGQLPSLNEFKDSTKSRTEIRPVALEDLLGRAQTVLDCESMKRLVENKKILITGAGGSIGSELARQIVALKPEAIMLLDHSEYALYLIDRELEGSPPEITREARLCDIRDADHVEVLMNTFRPDLVFHAAALKHVPLAETNIVETLHTNVLGTRNVAQACKANNVARMVMISTDKAVNPTNVMGASKRLAETYCQAQLSDASCPTQFITVRFGNVLGSNGSVVPLFKHQLEQGGPLTITHADIVRYFMTIREAVELVIQAAALGNVQNEEINGIFVLNMGKPIKIVDLARQMIRLAGREPDKDIQLVFTGLRPGEKLYEELFYAQEEKRPTQNDNILIAHATLPPLAEIQKALDLLRQHVRQRDEKAALQLLKKLVPAYRPEIGERAA